VFEIAIDFLGAARKRHNVVSTAKSLRNDPATYATGRTKNYEFHDNLLLRPHMT
jgi:hypothetical protein